MGSGLNQTHKQRSLDELAALVPDGAPIALGGSFLHRGPFGFAGVATPIAVFVKRDGRLALQSWHPESSLAEVRERTGFEFDAEGAGPTPPPTGAERRALRELDADGCFERDAAVTLR